ncbi:MAG: B12-binding domain-containing radical SAM protein [Clostridiales bacterium]|nr:B12-binding domain-containing radical SAM protein [Clostridiales bacterium]
MKILLTALNTQYVHSNLAVRYLKAFTKDLPYEGVIREFTINERENNILKEIIEEKPNVVCFSVYIWNVEMVQRLANLIKVVNKDIEILFGGPEVSYDSKEFLDKAFGDYVIEGEGEETFREFVQYKLGLKKIENIKGIHYKVNGNTISNDKRELLKMDQLIFPYEEDEDLNNKIVYYEGSRGCPFKCKYCLSSTTHGVRFHSIERTKNELQYFIDKKVKLVKFVDRTFNCNHKYAMAIWEFLINSNTETRFHFEISADILEDEEIQLLRKAPKGRFQFEIGVQTTNNKVLKNINRFVNFEDIEEKVDELSKMKNIHQHLDLIAGLPEEDYESFKESFNDVHSINPEMIQLGFLKLLKGSTMRDEAEKYGMAYSPYPPYEILRTSKLSYFDIINLKKVEEMVDKYYNSQKFNNILSFFYKKFETPFDFFQELGNYFENKGYFNRNIGNSEYYKVFLDFNVEILKGKEEYLTDIIKFDYLSNNKRRGMPSFIRSEVAKEDEEEIKNKYRDIYSFREYQIEEFSIDIQEYISKGIVKKEKVFCLVNKEMGMKFIK